MLAVKRRLGGPILFSTLSVVTIIILLLQQPELPNQFTKIPILGNGAWRWGSQQENDLVDGLRLVIFGDSWVDSSIPEGQEGRGKSWTDTLCAALHCSSKLNYARSQPAASDDPSNLPTGVVTSNKIQENATSHTQTLFNERANLTLPDLSAQIQSFIERPAKANERYEAIFALSIGFWDIYHLADLEVEQSYRTISASIDALISQVDILYAHFNTNLVKSLSKTSWTAKTPPPPFRLIIPKLIDPSMLPGWQTQRPLPRPPSNIAEQQRNAVYLTKRWNALLETKMLTWAQSDPSRSAQAGDAKRAPRNADREIFFYDFPSYILDLIIERSLEIDGLTDADGLGTGQSPLLDVFLPCVSEEDPSRHSSAEYVELNGRMVCKSPRAYLWWDGWSLGSLASEEVGKRVGKMVREGDFLGKPPPPPEEEGFQAS